jgi:hypothetical protein
MSCLRLCRDLGSRIATTNGKVLPVEGVSETTLIELLEIALALFLKEQL